MKEPRYCELSQAIKVARYAQDVKPAEMAERANIGLTTYYNRLSEPMDMTIGELISFCCTLHLDPVELMQRVMGGKKYV